MTSVGFATLDVIPAVKGLKAELQKQTSGDLASAGKTGGRLFGDSASKEAVTSFGKVKGQFASIAKDAVAPLAGIFAGAAAFNFLKGSFTEAREAATVGRQTAAVLKATGGAAQVSAGQVGDLASALSKKVAVDDEAIQSGENLLLTFRNIKNEAGTGNDIFNQATEAILNVSAAMDQDLKASAVQVGKALNDPIKGMSAMQRIGVTFTDQQKEQAKALVATGDVLGAQKIILRELNKEFGGAAKAGTDATDRMSVAFGNLQESLGTALMPAVTGFANVTTKVLIPGLESAGGAVGDAAQAFGSLPTPVKAATGALIAFRIAQATGITTSFATGVGSLSKGLDDLRLRGMLAGDELRRLKGGTLEINGQVGKLTPGVGRLNASLGALRVGAAGAGGALKRGLGGALGLLGGPWGLALAAGTVALTHFWQESQKAKAEVNAFVDTLKAGTGAFTEMSRQAVAQKLFDTGALDDAKALGIDLNLITDAALGNASAFKQLNGALAASGDGDKTFTILSALSEAGGTAVDAQRKFALVAEASRDVADAAGSSASATKTSTAATKGASSALQTYARTVSEARGEIKALADAENKRRLSLIQDRRDRIALLDTLAATRVEARKGKQTLDESTQAGRDNMSSLLDLADQWNQSTPKVQNARGAYKQLRQQFIDLADQMNGPNGTREQARKLAEQLLKVPKSAPVRFKSEGFQELMAQIKELQQQKIFIETTFGTPHAGSPGGREAPDDLSSGRPRTPRSVTTSPRGVTVNIGQVVAHDYQDFMTQADRRTSAATLDGVHR